MVKKELIPAHVHETKIDIYIIGGFRNVSQDGKFIVTILCESLLRYNSLPLLKHLNEVKMFGKITYCATGSKRYKPYHGQPR